MARREMIGMPAVEPHHANAKAHGIVRSRARPGQGRPARPRSGTAQARFAEGLWTLRCGAWLAYPPFPAKRDA